MKHFSRFFSEETHNFELQITNEEDTDMPKEKMIGRLQDAVVK
jgi:hypothetical protein